MSKSLISDMLMNVCVDDMRCNGRLKRGLNALRASSTGD